MGKRKRQSYFGKVVWPKTDSLSVSRKRRSSDEVRLDLESEPALEEEAVEQRVPNNIDESSTEEGCDSGQTVNDVNEKLLVVEEDDHKELPDNIDKTPVKKKKAGPHIVSFMIEGNRESPEQKPPGIESSLPSAGAISSGQISSDSGISAFPAEEETSGSTSSEIKSKIPVKPIDHRNYEEGEMGDEYYVARNDSESIVVRKMHPECKVIIPSDYSTALNEIKTCPLDCPYKVIEVAEIDQITLRKR